MSSSRPISSNSGGNGTDQVILRDDFGLPIRTHRAAAAAAPNNITPSVAAASGAITGTTTTTTTTATANNREFIRPKLPLPLPPKPAKPSSKPSGLLLSGSSTGAVPPSVPPPSAQLPPASSSSSTSNASSNNQPDRSGSSSIRGNIAAAAVASLNASFGKASRYQELQADGRPDAAAAGNRNDDSSDSSDDDDDDAGEGGGNRGSQNRLQNKGEVLTPLQSQRESTTSATASRGSIDGGADARQPSIQPRGRSQRTLRLKKLVSAAEAEMHAEGYGEEVVCIDAADDHAVIKFLTRNNTFGFPGTDGSMISNYIRFVFQQHPLLSLCLGHKLHPYTKRQRVIVLFCVLSFAFCISVALLDNFYYEQLRVCDAGCNDVDGVCVGGGNDGMTHDEFKRNCEYYRPWVLALVCGTVLVPYNSLLTYVSSCSCLHGKKFFKFHIIGTSCKSCMEYCGGRTMIFVIIYSIAMIGYSLYRCHVRDDNYNVAVTVLESKLWSFLEWFAWTAPYFAMRYTNDKRAFYKSLRRKRAADETTAGRDSAASASSSGDPRSNSGSNSNSNSNSNSSSSNRNNSTTTASATTSGGRASSGGDIEMAVTRQRVASTKL